MKDSKQFEMVGKASRSYVPLYPVQRQPVEQTREEESLWYFPDVRIADSGGSFVDSMKQKSNHSDQRTRQHQHRKSVVSNDQNMPPPKAKPHRRMNSQVVGALENDKEENIKYAGGSKKVKAVCYSF